MSEAKTDEPTGKLVVGTFLTLDGCHWSKPNAAKQAFTA